MAATLLALEVGAANREHLKELQSRLDSIDAWEAFHLRHACQPERRYEASKIKAVYVLGPTGQPTRRPLRETFKHIGGEMTPGQAPPGHFEEELASVLDQMTAR